MPSHVIHFLPCHSVWASDTLYFRSSRSHLALSDGVAQVVMKVSHFPSSTPWCSLITTIPYRIMPASQGKWVTRVFSHSELPIASSSSHSAMKESKLLFKQVWPCALLSSGQLFRRHLMLNMDLLTEMSYSCLGSWQTAGESQEEQKRFIGKKVFCYRQGKKNRNVKSKKQENERNPGDRSCLLSSWRKRLANIQINLGK